MLSIWGIISIARLKTESVYVGSAVGSRWLLKADHILVKRCIIEQSLPSRERGLKSKDWRAAFAVVLSLPSRERGLKSGHRRYHPGAVAVAPFAGAWIEIGSFWPTGSRIAGRSLRGSVD